jgi:mono/diheme cytochrome c family protein
MSNTRNAHQRTLAVLAALLASTWAGSASAATGEENFTKVCGACHTVGGGKLVGPDLKDVTKRRTDEWLLKFLKSPKAMIDSGDATAVGLFKEFNLVMPDPTYSEPELKDILAFITTKSGGAPAPVPAAEPVHEATPGEIATGQALFQGLIRLKNDGPSCNSCHHVKNDEVIGGGVLAKELTQAFTRLGDKGIHNVLGTLPFPVMEQAYKNHPLTPDEVTALIGFLQDADHKQQFQQPRDFGFRLVGSGIAGLVPLFGIYSFVWRRRKVRPVNERVFDRQVKGEDDVIT